MLVMGFQNLEVGIMTNISEYLEGVRGDFPAFMNFRKKKHLIPVHAFQLGVYKHIPFMHWEVIISFASKN